MFQFWTKTPPNRTGYWWFKNSEDNVEIVFVDQLKLNSLSKEQNPNEWWGTTRLAEPKNVSH